MDVLLVAGGLAAPTRSSQSGEAKAEKGEGAGFWDCFKAKIIKCWIIAIRLR